MDPDLPAAERLLLDVAAEFGTGGALALVDTAAALLPAASARLRPSAIAVHCDRLADEESARSVIAGTGTAAGVEPEPDAALRGARLVLFRLPPALDALDELAGRAAALGDERLVMLGVGNSRHLHHGMNTVLGRSFTEVRASLGRGRYRVLIATGRRAVDEPDDDHGGRFPRQAELADPGLGDPGLVVRAHGGAFAGARLDPGTRLLVGTRDRWPAPRPGTSAVDLGCGTGILAVLLARLGHPQVEAIDDSVAACRSARATAAANGLGEVITVRREDGLTARPDRTAGLVVGNPPFHRGFAKDSTPAFEMITEASRVLADQGELWLVFNSHLPYLPALRRLGATELITRDRSYLVTRTVRSVSAS